MTLEIEIYDSMEEARNAKLRTAIRHLLKQEPIKTESILDGKYKITWALPNDTQHSTNKPQEPYVKSELESIVEQLQDTQDLILAEIDAMHAGVLTRIKDALLRR